MSRNGHPGGRTLGLYLGQDPETADRARKVLEAAGLRIEWRLAGSVEEFAASLAGGRYEVVLAAEIPGLPLRGVQEALGRAGVRAPLVALTTLADEASALECLKQGAEDYVFEDRLARLPRVVERALARHASLEEWQCRAGSPPALCQAAPRNLEGTRRESCRAGRQFQVLAESIHEVFWMVNADASEVQYVSPAYEAIWGRSCQSLYEEPSAWMEAIHPEDRPGAAACYTRQLKGEALENEYRIVQPDGSVRWIRDRAFPIRDDSGQIAGLAGVAEDTTTRKQTEEALRQIESRFRRLADTNIIGVFTATSHGQILEANQAFLDMVGYSREDLLAGAIRWDKMTPPEFRDVGRQIASELAATGVTVPLEKEYIRKDGSRVPVMIGLAAGEDSRIGYVVDLRPVKRAERQLRATEGRLQSLLGSFDDVIFEMDADTRFLNVWDRSRSLRILPKEELIGRRGIEVTAGTFFLRIRDAVRRVLAGGPSEELEFSVEAQGQTRWYLGRVSPILSAAGTYETASLIARDITARKQEEEELRAAKEAAEAADRAKSNSWPT